MDTRIQYRLKSGRWKFMKTNNCFVHSMEAAIALIRSTYCETSYYDYGVELKIKHEDNSFWDNY